MAESVGYRGVRKAQPFQWDRKRPERSVWKAKAKGSNKRNPREGWQQSLKKVIKMTSAAVNGHKILKELIEPS